MATSLKTKRGFGAARRNRPVYKNHMFDLKKSILNRRSISLRLQTSARKPRTNRLSLCSCKCSDHAGIDLVPAFRSLASEEAAPRGGGRPGVLVGPLPSQLHALASGRRRGVGTRHNSGRGNTEEGWVGLPPTPRSRSSPPPLAPQNAADLETGSSQVQGLACGHVEQAGPDPA